MPTNPPKITIVGAGGYVFPIRLTVDILSFPELRECTLCLYDISLPRARRTQKLVEGIVKRNKLPTRVEVTDNRTKAMEGANYVIVAFQVGGVDAYRYDVEIPRKYGIDQCVGDTLGAGGVFRGLRSIAALKGIAEDMRKVSADALMLQYANPMAMNCWATNLLRVKTVGLCHSVQGTSRMLMHHLGVPYDEVSFKSAGINHQAWFTEFRHEGKDLYPRLKQVMDKKFPSPFSRKQASATAGTKFEQRGLDHQITDEVYYFEKVRTEIMRTFGYFHTESSHHAGEYVPWFRKNKELIDAYIQKRWDYYEISASYQHGSHQEFLNKLCAGPLECSEEYGARIIHAMETDEKTVIYGNVPNWGAPGSDPTAATRSHIIPNLPINCCVEVACLVDRNGVQPTAAGPLPPQCAAVNRTNVNVQELAVEAALTGNRDLVHQAIALDPLTSSVLALPQIRSMVDELFAKESRWLPQFAKAKSAPVRRR
jgi:alpha-galactosidase